MLRRKFLLASAALLLLTSPVATPAQAGSGTLSNQQAEKAIRTFFSRGVRTLVVQGVEQQGTRAGAHFFFYDGVVQSWCDLPGPQGCGWYKLTANAVAIFVHYNDGRWVLQQIKTDHGDSWNLSIVVP